MSENETLESEEAVETPPAADELSEEVRLRREAALARIVTFGNPILKSRATDVREFGAELAEEAERMIGIMQDALGVGLAATQLGVMHRLLVFQAGQDATPTALANPELEWLSKETVIAEEGCLSLPRIAVDVDRPLHARVRGVDPSGEPVLIEASGLEAERPPARDRPPGRSPDPRSHSTRAAQGRAPGAARGRELRAARRRGRGSRRP